MKHAKTTVSIGEQRLHMSLNIDASLGLVSITTAVHLKTDVPGERGARRPV